MKTDVKGATAVFWPVLILALILAGGLILGGYRRGALKPNLATRLGETEAQIKDQLAAREEEKSGH